ncbi:MAG: hypothetical protein AB7O39_04460 [Flavobacteriaceae bacterium]
MDSLIFAASRALASGDALGALKRIALREDAPALALRGIAMAQLGDLPRARELLRRAARAFGSREPAGRARCVVAEAEIALVSRDLGRGLDGLLPAGKTLEALGERANAAHARYLEARRLLLIGRLDEAVVLLETVAPETLPPASLVGCELVRAGIAMRRVEASSAKSALERALSAAKASKIGPLVAETERACRALDMPVARLAGQGEARLLRLADVEALFASGALIVDACRNLVRLRDSLVRLAGRPVLFSLARTLAEAWPGGASRESLLSRAFNARHADESHRARLRVEIGRLRRELSEVSAIAATSGGFRLAPREAEAVVVLTPPVERNHADVLALLADGEAWSSSALALALSVSPRTAQRALEALADAGEVESFGRGPARRWIARTIPGFPTSLLLPLVADVR